MSSRFTRRTFIRSISAAGLTLPLAMPRVVRAVQPSSRINLASVGVAGKGWEDLIASSGDGKLHNVVALCDIDHRNGGDQPSNLGQAQARRPLGIGAAAEKFPSARRYADFRKMLDDHRDIDAVTVSTPDHMHATIALSAMALGKHVYVQKPLTQTVHESRIMRLVAARNKLVTQMGNQFHSSIGYRCLVEVIRSGAIGKIREAHAWCSSPSWPQGIPKPAGQDPIPDAVHWDLWLGAAPPRPYKHQVYHNFNWRGWQEFGTGALGDMGCHIIDPVAWSLELGAPRSVSAQVSSTNDQTYPESSSVNYQFSPTTYTTAEPFSLTWYDGGNLPPIALAQMPETYNLPKNGSLFIGEQGVLLTSHHPSAPRLYPEEKFREYSITTLRELYKTFESLDHYRVWTDAILNSTQANSHFDYAGPLNETVMVGTIAQRLPQQTLLWDPNALAFTNEPKATALVRRSYRKGWDIQALS